MEKVEYEFPSTVTLLHMAQVFLCLHLIVFAAIFQ